MDNQFASPWYNPEWFSFSMLQSFTWETKWFLYLAMASPLIFLIRWIIRHQSNQKLPVAVTARELKTSAVNLIRFIPDLFLLLSLMLIFVALARPQRSNEKLEQWTQGIDIMIGLDISQSMLIEDFEPNRLEAAKQVALSFINGRKQDRIGIVIFSGDAYSLSPLTTDYDLLRTLVRDINFDMMQTRGTAIGSAMGVMTNRMRESEAKSKVCILLSDGDNNAGNIDPITAAELGAAFGVTIYTILVGREGYVPFGKDFFGNPQMIENTVDDTTLKRMAEIGKGQFFRATDQQALETVFKQIDEYEKAEIKELRYRETSDYYFVYLTWAICFFLMWLLLKSTFLANILQD
jgi:Ca-activated chloride channel family protein